jgi:hypothetical protein
MSNHGVEDRGHLAQHGDQSCLWLDSATEQALVIVTPRRVTAHRTERGHVEHLTDTPTAPGDMSSAVPLATIVIIITLIAIEAAKIVQPFGFAEGGPIPASDRSPSSHMAASTCSIGLKWHT